MKQDTELTADDLKELIRIYKAKIREVLGKEFPDDPMEQLWGGIRAVFQSWNGKRAISYRRIEGIPDEWGTAVTVQAMVFGNMGEDSGTGVAFTRNPATGENVFYGEWLPNAQGEDVVAGIRTPYPINEAGKTEHTARPAVPGEAVRRDLQRAGRHRAAAGEALPRHARPGVHHREGQAVDAAVPRGQAQRPRGRAHGGGHGAARS